MVPLKDISKIQNYVFVSHKFIYLMSIKRINDWKRENEDIGDNTKNIKDTNEANETEK